jgi:hypothetical protein
MAATLSLQNGAMRYAYCAVRATGLLVGYGDERRSGWREPHAFVATAQPNDEWH